MSSFPPLVTYAGQIKQLQSGEELDIPLEARHQRLKMRFDLLVVYLVDQGFDLPAEVINEVKL